MTFLTEHQSEVLKRTRLFTKSRKGWQGRKRPRTDQESAAEEQRNAKRQLKIRVPKSCCNEGTGTNVYRCYACCGDYDDWDLHKELCKNPELERIHPDFPFIPAPDGIVAKSQAAREKLARKCLAFPGMCWSGEPSSHCLCGQPLSLSGMRLGYCPKCAECMQDRKPGKRGWKRMLDEHR